MANQSKNFLFRRIRKATRNYESAKLQAAQASWILRHADQEIILSGSRPGLINKYKVNGVTGAWTLVSKDEVKV